MQSTCEQHFVCWVASSDEDTDADGRFDSTTIRHLLSGGAMMKQTCLGYTISMLNWDVPGFAGVE